MRCKVNHAIAGGSRVLGTGALVLFVLAACRTGTLEADKTSKATPMTRPQVSLDRGVEAFLAQFPDKFGTVLANPAQHRLQILIARVIDGAAGPELERFGYRLGAEYFYPASSVKLFAVAAALERLNELDRGEAKITLDTPLAFAPLFEGEELEEVDSSNLDGQGIEVGHLVREIFLVSDNQAFNWLYELVGHEELNRRSWRAGFDSLRLHHRLSELRPREDHYRTPAIEVRSQPPIRIPERISTLELDNLAAGGDETQFEIGRAHYVDGELKKEPLSFRYKNQVSLRDLQDLLVMVVRPDVDLSAPDSSTGAEQREPFRLSDEQRAFVMDVMPLYPRQSTNPRYDAAEYPDDYVKFLLPGLVRVIDESRLRIYNKVGSAYGFLIENAMVEDTRTGRSFFVAAVIYSNPNATLNDDTYGYDSVGLPFMADLGEVLAREFFLEEDR